MPEASRRTVFSAMSMRLEDFLRLFKQIAAGFGEPDLARGALEQLDAEPVLEFQHDPADRRLGHRQALRGAVEVEFFRHRHEGRKVLQIVAHIDSNFSINCCGKDYFTSESRLSSTYIN